MSGSVLALDQVPDSTFASGLLGKGVAIIPAVGKVIAPFFWRGRLAVSD